MTASRPPADAHLTAAAHAASAGDDIPARSASDFAEHSARLTRELINALVAEHDDGALAARITEISGRLSQAAAAPEKIVVTDPHPNVRHIGYDITPASGARNPIAPPMDIHWTGEQSECRITMPLQYQGPPGRVHGGMVALLLDHVLGNAANAGEVPRSFTRYLNVSYEAATPIDEPLLIVGRPARHEGRKRFMEGEIICGGTVRVRAEGLWIEPRPAG